MAEDVLAAEVALEVEAAEGVVPVAAVEVVLVGGNKS